MNFIICLVYNILLIYYIHLLAFTHYKFGSLQSSEERLDQTTNNKLQKVKGGDTQIPRGKS